MFRAVNMYVISFPSKKGFEIKMFILFFFFFACAVPMRKDQKRKQKERNFSFIKRKVFS